MYRINYSYGSNIIPEESEGIIIYNLEGEYINFIPFSLPTTNEIYFVSAKDKVFIFRMPNYETITSYSYFSKDDIKSGNLTWTDIN